MGSVEPNADKLTEKSFNRTTWSVQSQKRQYPFGAQDKVKSRLVELAEMEHEEKMKLLGLKAEHAKMQHEKQMSILSLNEENAKLKKIKLLRQLGEVQDLNNTEGIHAHGYNINNVVNVPYTSSMRSLSPEMQEALIPRKTSTATRRSSTATLATASVPICSADNTSGLWQPF